jgi:ATP-binding cassette subfamily B protein
VGRVTLDGVDERSIAVAELRRSVVMVTQESFLFSGTIGDNIMFGRPGASRDEMVAAAHAVGLDVFIDALPNGYETDVRRRGVRLSSGQHPLVAFARVHADPRVLILDEATSRSTFLRRLVQHALHHPAARPHRLIIAHRLSTVEIADRVLVVTQAGSWRMARPPSKREGGLCSLHRAWVESWPSRNRPSGRTVAS